MWCFFLEALSFSLAIALIGWLLSPKEKEPESDDVWLTGEYAQTYYDCIDYMERLYQSKK